MEIKANQTQSLLLASTQSMPTVLLKWKKKKVFNSTAQLAKSKATVSFLVPLKIKISIEFAKML